MTSIEQTWGGKKHSRRVFGKGLLAAAAGLGGAAVGGGTVGALMNATNEGEEQSQNGVALKEIRQGEELLPVGDSIREGANSGFINRQVSVVHSKSQLEKALLRIRDPKTLKPIKYDFKPGEEVVVVAALGNVDFAPYEVEGVDYKGDSIRVDVREEEGIMRVTPHEDRTFFSHGVTVDGEQPIKHPGSPFFMAKYPVVSMNGERLPWEVAIQPEVKHFVPDSTITS